MIKSLEEFRVYNLAMDLGEEVWKVLSGWDYFAKDTVGKQLVRACDSVAANLSEGLGRYHIKEPKNLSYYSRGSLFETKTWLGKAHNRNLIEEVVYTKMMQEIEVIGRMMNSYIKTLDVNSVMKEDSEEYVVITLKPLIPSPKS